jgi:predicted Zn-dependent protease
VIRLEIKGLYCSKAKERNLKELDFFARRVSEYIPQKYPLVQECVYCGVENIDSIIREETLKERIERIIGGILWWEVLPSIYFDTYRNVYAIYVNQFKYYLQSRTKDRVIGITNVHIHNGVKIIGGFPLDNGIIESLTYWKTYLKKCGKFSPNLLVKTLAKSCVHEVAESYGCTHHEGDCLMDILTEALYRPERLCGECERRIIEHHELKRREGFLAEVNLS